MIESLIEAFDYCRANFDFKDISHLACSKVCYHTSYFILSSGRDLS
jgi:hypothetical protein